MNCLPACYFPTITLLVDDQPRFLENLAFELGNDTTNFMLYSRPQHALHYFTEQYRPLNFLNKSIKHTEDDDIDHRSVDIDISDIHREIYNPQRFAQVSTLVVDYSMPGLNGAELAEAVHHFPLKIILLTGEASNEHAIELFNKGIIQHFVRKDAADATRQLQDAIAQLQYQYFCEQSATITNGIIQKSLQFDYPPPSCLNDPIFIDYFSQIIAKYNICEYYLIEESGSYLCADSDGNLSWLLVKHNGDMEALDDEVKFAGKSLPTEFVEKIKTREVIRHIFDRAQLQEHNVNWAKHLFPAEKLSGHSDYYCSYVTHPSTLPQMTGPIESYRDFCNGFNTE